MDESIIVSAQLPRELVNWLDTILVERRAATLKASNQDSPIPTRSSFIRELLLKAKNNGHNL